MSTISLAPGSRNMPPQLTMLDQVAHRGGEGSLYFTTDNKYAVKIYKKVAPDKPRLLQMVIDLGRNLGDDEQFLAWPLGVIDKMDGQAACGVATRFVPYKPLYHYIYSPKDVEKQFRDGRSWLEYLKLARGTAAALRAVHGKGIAHGDVHLKNFLANPVNGEVVMIDLDGVVVKGFLPPQVKGMPGFIAPEVVMNKSKPEELTDRHSLAVLVLWILLFRNVMRSQTTYDPDDQEHDDLLSYGQHAAFSENPNDRSNWVPRIGTPLFRSGVLSYRALTPKLQELTERALIQGLHDPQKRPQAAEWERALAEAYDVLISCATCRQSYFYQYWLQPPPRRQCPFCGATTRQPFPAVAELMDTAARGVHVPARTIAMYHGLPLFADVIESRNVPPFTRKGVAIVGQTAWDANEGVHRLLNNSDTPWLAIAGASGSIGRGTSVPLRRGLLLSFGDGKRLLRVVE
jgi:DNA-binding helix-hairpin-helix protein with protein kinase domain